MAKQTVGAGVRAGMGRPCPVCGVRFDPSIDGWQCIHNVYATSSYAQKRVAAELVIQARLDAEDREDAMHRAGYGPPIDSPAPAGAGTMGEGELSGHAGNSESSDPSLAGDSCAHGFSSWTDCTACVNAADFDDGEPTGATL